MKQPALALILVGACGGGAKSTDTTTPTPVSNTAVAMDDEPVAGDATNAKKPVDEMNHDEAVAAAQAAGVLGDPNAPPAGPLDKDSIRAVVKSHIQAVTYCYEKRLLEVPDLTGTTTVTFVIGTDGKVTSSTGAGFDPAVDTCVGDLVKTFTFPAPDAGVFEVRYPFTFKPVSN